MGLFGRKKVEPAPDGPGQGGTDPKDQPGHRAVLATLRDQERTDPGVRERLAGTVVFDLAYKLVQNERGARIEDVLAMLASVGGHQCIAPILQAAPAGATYEQIGLHAIRGNDGRAFGFGDAPNALLFESEHSLLSAPLGAGLALGVPVTLDMLHAEMKKVASRAGGPDYEALDLPAQHMVESPIHWARHFNKKIVEALDLYDVPPMRRAAAIGYALEKAINLGSQVLDPAVAVQIILQCATRTSKFIG